MSGYTYLQSLGVENVDTQKLIVASGVGLALVACGLIGSSRLVSRLKKEDVAGYVVPEKKLSISGILDVFVGTFVSFQDSILGDENRKYLPLTGTIFIFIFLSNLLGLIPGFPGPTTSVWITAAIAIVIFMAFNVCGIKENGVLGYLKHFCGPVWWLAFLIFPIEIFGAIMRILTLNLRLYWNMSADHIVLGTMTGISQYTQYVMPVIFYALGTFVSFMQAFVPTVLTMVYILLATQHGDEEHH